MSEVLDHSQSKTPRLKIKHVIILYILGEIVLSIGGFFKLESLMWASELLFIGYFIRMISLVLGLVKLFSIKDVKSVFNQ